MEYKIALQTDIGPVKSSNQDSMCVKEAFTDAGSVLLAAICDGMGGLEKGELASKTLVEALDVWFERELPQLLGSPEPLEDIRESLDELLKQLNRRIGDYGRMHRLQLGSTVTAMLILADGRFLIAHVGDSRAYRITDSSLDILTEDQTVAAREMRMGRLSPEEAEQDPRRNVLLQCIGASKTVVPVFVQGKAWPNECFMLCSDGFRHEISAREFREAFAPANNGNEALMRRNVIDLIERNIQRGETDNISAMLIRTIQGD